MKAAVLSALSLCLITALCVFSSAKINAICNDTEAFVNGLSETTGGTSEDECKSAVEKWERDSAFLSLFVSSSDVSTVKEGLITLQNAVAVGSDDEFATAKASLIVNLELMRKYESISLENIF